MCSTFAQICDFPNVCRVCLKSTKEAEFFELFDPHPEHGVSYWEILQEILQQPAKTGHDLPQQVCIDCGYRLGEIRQFKLDANLANQFNEAFADAANFNNDPMIDLFDQQNMAIRELLAKRRVTTDEHFLLEDLLVSIGQEQQQSQTMELEVEMVDIKLENTSDSEQEEENIAAETINATDCEPEGEMEKIVKENATDSEPEEQRVDPSPTTSDAEYDTDTQSLLDGDGFRCPLGKCGELLKSGGRYSEHQKTKHRYICSTCGMVTENLNTIKGHVLLHQENSDTILCPFCPQRFRVQAKLRGHVRERHPNKRLDYDCEKCDMKFKSVKLLRDHRNKGHPVEHSPVCPECKERFSTVAKLRYHLLRLHQSKLFLCKACPKLFSTDWERCIHYGKTHDVCEDYHEASLNCVTPQKCLKCERSFDTEERMQIHMLETHDNPVPKTIYSGARKGRYSFQCPICGKRFRVFSSLCSHSKIHHKTYFKIKDESVYRQPNSDSESNSSDSDGVDDEDFFEPFGGEEEHERSGSSQENKRIKLENSSAKCETKEKSPQQQPPMMMVQIGMEKCPLEGCGEYINTINDNHQHEKHRVGCLICGAAFHSEQAARKHVLIHKKQENEYECSICHTHFRHGRMLRKHFQKTHGTPMETYQCDLCELNFDSPSRTMEHRRTHVAIKCPNCPALICSNYREFYDHFKSEHANNLHKCNLCPKTFIFANGLKVHRNEHVKYQLDASVFHFSLNVSTVMTCKACSMPFYNAEFLEEHIFDTHGKRRRKPKKPQCQSDADQPEVCKFACATCGLPFSSRRGLIGHMRSHARDFFFECKYCDTKWSNRKDFYEHVQQAHLEDV